MRIPEFLGDQIDEIAARDCRKPSEIVREALVRYMSKEVGQ